MSSIVTIVNQKGGTGKSTIAFNLAAGLSHLGKSTYIADADPQGTISKWSLARSRQKEGIIDQNISLSKTPVSPKELISIINISKSDFTIIDCGPANNQIIKAALVVSNIAIIPISPSPLDIDSARSTIELIKHGTDKKAINIKTYLLISKKIVGTNLANEVRSAVKVLGFPVLNSEISQRVAFCESPINGQSIIEYTPKSVAAEEFISLAKEIIKCLKQN